MKILWGAIIAFTVLVSIVVAGELYTRSSDEAAFSQLPVSYQQIPLYPNAQNVWRGTVQEEIVWRVNGTRIITFTTTDPTDKVMDYYRTTLESSGCRYDTHGEVISGCSPMTVFDGDFYINAQDGYVWVAVKNTGGNTEYQIFKVPRSFWRSGLCP